MFVAPKAPVPVFPLPGFVLYPGATVPLHVFEPRYRALVRDAALGDRWVAMATLAPGWEEDTQGRPAFLPLGCLGAIETLEWLPDDRYHLVLRGVIRVTFARTDREYPYRTCEVDPEPGAPCDEGDPMTAMSRTSLLKARSRLLPLGPEAWVLPPEVDDDAPFEQLVGVIAQSLRAPLERRLEWLACDRLTDRARDMLRHMKKLSGETGEAGA